MALAEGLECITLRRIAEQLDVRPGLVSHYFPAVEDLVAEAFGKAAGGELDTLILAQRPDGTPLHHLARFFSLAAGAAYDDISRLWLNARHLSRYRPVLRERVTVQEAAWRGRLEGLLHEGVEQGELHTDDPYVTAIQILVVIDGLGAQANTDTGTGTGGRPDAVTRMAVLTAERELGLEDGTLARYATPETGAAAPAESVAPGSPGKAPAQ